MLSTWPLRQLLTDTLHSIINAAINLLLHGAIMRPTGCHNSLLKLRSDATLRFLHPQRLALQPVSLRFVLLATLAHHRSKCPIHKANSHFHSIHSLLVVLVSHASSLSTLIDIITCHLTPAAQASLLF